MVTHIRQANKAPSSNWANALKSYEQIWILSYIKNENLDNHLIQLHQKVGYYL